MNMHRSSPLPVVRALVAAGVLALVGGRVFAQIGLSEALVRSPQLTTAQAAELQAHVDAHKAGLSAEQSKDIRRARAALQDPLRTSGISGPFRQRYSDALVPVLRPLIAHARDEIAIGALRLAGDLGTKQGMDLLELALADKRQAVRFMAASSFRSAFRASRDATPAMSSAQAMSALQAIERALGAEGDPIVQDGLLLALDGATDVPPDRLEGIRDRAATLLGSAAGKYARQAGANAVVLGPILHAGKSLFELLSNANIRLSSSALVEAGGFAGDVFALGRRRLASGNLQQAERDELALAVGQAARVYFFAAQSLGGRPQDIKADEAIANSDDERFRAEAAKLIDAPGGALMAAPFNLPAERFKADNANANAAGRPGVAPQAPPNP